MGKDNARFFAFINGCDVKITLKPGQELEHGIGQSTDEGWKREYRCWTFDGNFVTELYDTVEKDCDGRMDRHAVFKCHVRKLKMGNEIEGDVVYPDWKEVSSRQRDHAAELAGY